MFISIRGCTCLLIALVLCPAASSAQNQDRKYYKSYDLKDSAVRYTAEASAPADSLALWYRRPAKEWTEALPLGNGRLGAMVFGGINREILQLNEDTLWAGGPYDASNRDALTALPEARKLVFEGKYKEAEDYINAHMMAHPLRQMPYQPLANLVIDFPPSTSVSGYRRELNLDSAIASTSYTAKEVKYRREVFISPVDQVIVMHLAADKPGQVNCMIGWQTEQAAAIATETTATLLLTGKNGAAQGIAGALKFQARVRVIAKGGTVAATSGALSVKDADSATILIAASTSYKSYKDVSGNPQSLTTAALAAAGKRSYEQLRARSVAEHQRLFRRVEINLGKSSVREEVPTDERISNFAGSNDPELAALYFQFGRYLLISSSRPGTQPATLQGIWNDNMQPPWESKYTININTEMNYWPAEETNLAETVEPLTKMVMDLSVTGARTAKVQYGADGWVAHHNTDLWRATAPVDKASAGMWPMGGAWLSLELWDHYDYSRNRNYLKKIYPVLKGASQFFLDTLVEEPKHHWLVTNPSLSPENKHPSGSSIVDGPTIDEQILRDLFDKTIRSAELLGVDADFRERLRNERARLAPNQIGHAGQLQEWLEDWDLNAPQIHHRHVSHLFGLYPSWQINLRDTPALAAAARKSLEIRGDEATGWGLAWRLNLWARLHDGEHAYRILTLLVRPDRTYSNMFDAHPPFQIDGNFGGTAGIAEMLLQSHSDEIEFLPALPKEWANGNVTGLRARGGFEVNIQWRHGELTSAKIRSALNNSATLRYGSAKKVIHLRAGDSFVWKP